MQDWSAKAINTYKQIYGYSAGENMADKKTVDHAKSVIDSIMTSNDKDTKAKQLSEALYDDILKIINGGKYGGEIEVVSALDVLDLVRYDLMTVMMDSGDEQV